MFESVSELASHISSVCFRTCVLSSCSNTLKFIRLDLADVSKKLRNAQ